MSIPINLTAVSPCYLHEEYAFTNGLAMGFIIPIIIVIIYFIISKKEASKKHR